MGLLAEFFVATEVEAMQYSGDPGCPDSHKALYKRFTEVELETLYDITLGKSVSDDDETSHEFKVVKVVDDGEQVTTELLPDLIARLANASDETLESWAGTWGATTEIQSDADAVLPVLQDLRRLAIMAQSESKSVYLWNCL